MTLAWSLATPVSGAPSSWSIGSWAVSSPGVPAVQLRARARVIVVSGNMERVVGESWLPGKVGLSQPAGWASLDTVEQGGQLLVRGTGLARRLEVGEHFGHQATGVAAELGLELV